MKKLWQTHRENIVSFCAIVSTMVGITGLCLKLAELQPQSQSGTAIQTEIQTKEKPQSELVLPTETQRR